MQWTISSQFVNVIPVIIMQMVQRLNISGKL